MGIYFRFISKVFHLPRIRIWLELICQRCAKIIWILCYRWKTLSLHFCKIFSYWTWEKWNQNIFNISWKLFCCIIFASLIQETRRCFPSANIFDIFADQPWEGLTLGEFGGRFRAFRVLVASGVEPLTWKCGDTGEVSYLIKSVVKLDYGPGKSNNLA